jgi:hypothetical protein
MFSGMTHSAAMAGEILVGKTILEALNTDLVCDAINTAMRELFLQIVYGRTQSAFSEGWSYNRCRIRRFRKRNKKPSRYNIFNIIKRTKISRISRRLYNRNRIR